MKRFLVLYLAPVSVLEDWSKTDEQTRKTFEEKMKGEWNTWMEANKEALVEGTLGAGKTKLVTTQGVTDTKNDVMLYSIVQAQSPEEAAAIFEGHPHLQIPQATIEIMEANKLPGMGS